ncbi:nitroreductase family protein [Pseudogracilibacillus auburnensis]|uniref:nitroreductase family protein n=1 Tax=Pseudogracilibacillus auburnensis TaxID=1494959 RepID=UPI001A95F4F9|nr:nitroreductase [Pseudogracilibacillus auburnensis]MBO1005090.1 nitroreductase [Pseudogracilibacillus auburnensis]
MIVTAKSLEEVIKERTSVKTGYLDKEVSKELVLSLLESAVWAPTHGVREPWRYIFVSGDRREAFIEAVLSCRDKSQRETVRRSLEDVPAFLIVVMNADPRQKFWEEDFAATACMLQNFQLLAWEKELGTVWRTPIHIHDPRFHEAVGVKSGEKVVGVLSMGYFDKEIVERKVRRRTNPAEKMSTF